jgi:hypothetical protein
VLKNPLPQQLLPVPHCGLALHAMVTLPAPQVAAQA